MSHIMLLLLCGSHISISCNCTTLYQIDLAIIEYSIMGLNQTMVGVIFQRDATNFHGAWTSVDVEINMSFKLTKKEIATSLFHLIIQSTCCFLLLHKSFPTRGRLSCWDWDGKEFLQDV